MVIILINKVIFIFFIPILIYSIYIWITKVPYYSKQQITITKLEREVKNFRELGFVIALFTIGWIIMIVFKQFQALILGKIKDV